jgi:hypothetical protein
MRFFSHILKKAAPVAKAVGSWNARKGRLKQKYPQLTDQDLVLDACNRDEMVRNLLSKLGKTEEELHAIIIAL